MDGQEKGQVKLRLAQVLTKRELEICGMVAKGLSNENIAKLLFLSAGTVKNHITSIYKKAGLRNRAQLAAYYTMEYAYAMTDNDPPAKPTPAIQADAVLTLIGARNLPDIIPIIFNNQPFIIGRFDVSLGRKQCDFEFDKATKAVSRRHAALARASRGYEVVDLGSSAGTFVNGQKITPGEPYPLISGDLISFGGAGADYVLRDV